MGREEEGHFRKTRSANDRAGRGNFYAGASPRMKRRGGRTDGRRDEEVLLLAHRPDRAEGRAVLYTNMYGEWIK